MRTYQRLVTIPALVAIAVATALLGTSGQPPTSAAPGAITVREQAYGLPHIFADTDAELAREAGRQVAKDRLGQLILIGRVGRGTLSQAFGLIAPSTINDDAEARRDGYTSSELNNMFAKLPADIQTFTLEYAKGVNDTIEEIYAGNLPEPLEVSLLKNVLGLGDDLFGNATNISDQVDPFYRAPGGADPERPNGGFQFTPEIAMAMAVLQVRSFGSESFGESSRLNELNALVAKFGGSIGAEIWDDLNFRNDPLAPVSVPDSTAPGFGGPLASLPAQTDDLLAQAGRFPDYDYDAALETVRQRQAQREEFARSIGAWPALGSYSWQIDGDRSATGNPWVGGFPQTGIQTPSIMHFMELRSAEGADHRIQGIGMVFVGAPLVLIGQSDNVGYTSTTAQLKNNDFFLDKLILESTDAIRYNDEGTPAPVSMRTETLLDFAGNPTPVVVWRTHERAANGGSRTVEAFQGNATGMVDSATANTLTDTGGFAGSFAGGHVAIIGGTGTGQMRPIASSTANTLTITGTWTTTPDTTSEYVAVKAGSDVVVISRDRAFWLEESISAYGFSFFQRAESVLDIRRGARLMPSTHNFPSADNQAFNGIGTDLGPGTGNTGFFSSGFSRIRQGVSPTDIRLPLDGTVTSELIVVSGTVDSATAGTLTDAGAFTGENFSPPALNFRLDNPSLQGSEYIVTITGGDGYKQTRRIASNDANTLTLEEDWGVTPSVGDLFEVYEIVAMPEAINPAAGYTSNWNNKAATADDGRGFGRQQRVIFILERLAADSTWTRDEQRQLNEDVAGLEGKGAFGRYLIPRLREAVDGVGNGGNTAVDTVLAALEVHIASPFFGRGFTDAVNDTMIAGEVTFLNSLISQLSSDIYGDEFSGTGLGTPGLDQIQHAIDAAAGGPLGAYAQKYTGDYFNAIDWRIVVRDALSTTATNLGGIPADIARPNSTYVHPLSALFPNLVFDPTPIGNRGIWEEIIEVGPTVLGEFIFPLGQSGFIDEFGMPDRHADSLHQFWANWRFVPMLHVAEDLTADPDGDVDNDGVLDGFEKYYFGSISPAPTDDADGDGLDLLGEYKSGLDPTNADTLANGITDDVEDLDQDGCTNLQEVSANELRGGQRDPLLYWDLFDTNLDGAVAFGDFLLVLQHFNTNDANGTAAISRSSDPITTADPGPGVYHPRFDRGGQAPGGDPWDELPPNGAIGFADFLSLLRQFGHTCA